jgi:uncharacterized protein YjiS (DUF1127 family)
MTHRHSHRRSIEPAEVLDCGSAIRLLGRDDYIARDHVFAVEPRPRGLVAALALWRRRYLTRRHLRELDQRGLADIGIDAIEREREAGKPFWMV